MTSVPSASRAKTPRLSLEPLEERAVPAVFAQLDRGVLGIWGTDGDDTIVVRQLAGRLSVDGVDILVRGVEVPSVTVGSVRRIEIACGAGDDEVYLNSHTVPGQQAITRPAYIWGEAGDDWIEAGQGHDTVDAGTGEDVVFGHGGNDVLWAEGSACWLYGGAGNDRVEAMAGEMVLDGGPGHDRMQAYGDGPAWVDGGPGNDRLIGGDGPDVLTGGPGNDYLLGGGGADDLDGGPGTDIMWGGWEPWRETLDDGVDTFRDEFSPTAITYRGAGLADVLQGGSPLCVTAASIAAAVRAGFDFRLSIAHLGGHEYAVALFDPTLGRWQAERVWFDGTWTDLDLNIPRARSGATLPEFWTVLVGRATLQQRGVDWTVADLDYVDRWYPTSASGMLGRLTGWETEALDPADLQAQDLWYALRSGQAVAALTFDDPPSAMYTPGIVPNHAYTVLAVYRSGSSWYVRLRNPWGVDFDPSVSRRPMGADDGIVALRWDHFVADFFAVAWSV